MKLGRKAILIGMLMLVGSVFIAVPVQAKPTRTVINFTYEMIADGAEREWITEDGIYQGRKNPHYGEVLTSDTDFSGDLYYLGDVRLNLVTYDGNGGGPFEFTGVYLDEEATFVGKLRFTIVGGYLTGKLNCFGTGSLQGHIKGTVEGWLGYPFTAQIIIWT